MSSSPAFRNPSAIAPPPPPPPPPHPPPPPPPPPPAAKMKLSAASFCLLVASAISPAAAFGPISSSFSSSRPAFATSLGATVESSTTSVPTASNFLTAEQAAACVEAVGSPLYAYSLPALAEAAEACLAFPNAYGLTVRYAMKACPNGAILSYLGSRGVHIDASSGYEVRRAMDAGIPAENISLSTQELPDNFAELMDMGVKVNAW